MFRFMIGVLAISLLTEQASADVLACRDLFEPPKSSWRLGTYLSGIWSQYREDAAAKKLLADLKDQLEGRRRLWAFRKEQRNQGLDLRSKTLLLYQHNIQQLNLNTSHMKTFGEGSVEKGAKNLTDLEVGRLRYSDLSTEEKNLIRASTIRETIQFRLRFFSFRLARTETTHLSYALDLAKAETSYLEAEIRRASLTKKTLQDLEQQYKQAQRTHSELQKKWQLLKQNENSEHLAAEGLQERLMRISQAAPELSEILVNLTSWDFYDPSGRLKSRADWEKTRNRMNEVIDEFHLGLEDPHESMYDL